MRRLTSSTAALFTVVFLSACGGGDSPTTPPGGGGGGGGGGGAARQILSDPSFQTNIQEIFSRTGCTAAGCHGTSPQAGLDLRSSAAYEALVDVGSTMEPGRTRVIPGDPANSYLVIKIEGRQSSGSRMPQGGTPLDNIDQTNIRNWISRGARNN